MNKWHLRSRFAFAACITRWIHCPFDFKSFVGYKEIETYVESLGGLKLGCTHEGRTIWALRVGDGPTCVLEAGIHAREWASPMAALYVIDKLINEPIGGVSWLIVPLLNPDGYEWSRKSHSNDVEKKHEQNEKPMVPGSGHQQELQYPVGKYVYFLDLAGCWNDPCMDTYCGVSAWSELETLAIRNQLSQEKDIRVYLSVHACLQSIMYPPAHSTEKPTDWEDLENVAVEIKKSIKGKYGTEYNVGQSSVLDRKASGSSIDWARQELGIKYAYNFELPGPDIGFLLPASDIEKMGKDLYEAVFSLSVAARSFQNMYIPAFKDTE